MTAIIKQITIVCNGAHMIIRALCFWLVVVGIVTLSTILGVLLTFIWLKQVQTAGVDIFSVLK